MNMETTRTFTIFFSILRKRYKKFLPEKLSLIMSWLLKQVNGVSRILHLSFLNQAEQSYHPIEEPA